MPTWAEPITSLISTIYLHGLTMMIYPLVFCSLIVGIKRIGSVSATGKVGGQALLYFIGTTLFASLLGLFLPKALNIGTGVAIEMAEAEVQAAEFTSIVDTAGPLFCMSGYSHPARIILKIGWLRLCLINQLLERDRAKIVTNHLVQSFPRRQCNAKAAPSAGVLSTLQTGHGVQWAFCQADNIPQCYLCWRYNQTIPTRLSPADAQQASRCQRGSKRLKVFFGDLLA